MPKHAPENDAAMTFEEIAQKLEISTSQAKWFYKSALRKLSQRKATFRDLQQAVDHQKSYSEKRDGVWEQWRKW